MGHICDACNAGIASGDLVQGYARRDSTDGWAIRSLRYMACSRPRLADPTPGTDEALVEAVFLKHRLASIEITDINTRWDGGDPHRFCE